MSTDDLTHAAAKLSTAWQEFVDELQKQFEREGSRSHHVPVTKRDLKVMEERLNMKLSEIKSAVASAAAKNKEAFAEIGTRIADLQQAIDDLKASALDPDVTDEAFLADLSALQSDAQKLADIVPGTPSDSNANANV